jgi:hypothetical protein
MINGCTFNGLAFPRGARKLGDPLASLNRHELLSGCIKRPFVLRVSSCACASTGSTS